MSNSNIQVFARIFLMGLLLLLSSCAAKKLLVRNADTLLEHQFEKRLPLYSQQKKVLSKDIKHLLKENRTQAQELFPVIDEIKIEEAQKVEGHYRRLLSTYDKIAQDISAILAKHMALLDSKQQKDFFKVLDDENRQLAKKDASERLDKLKERFETFFGDITEKQEQVLTNHQADFEAGNKVKLERRKQLHDKFRAIYQEDLSSTSRQEMFLEAFKDYQKNAHNHDKNIEIIKNLLPTISDEQKEFFRRRLAEVKEVLKLYLDTDY